MKIEGLGERIIEEFYNIGYIKTFSDIYKLENRKEELILLEGFGKKSVDNIIDSINKSKENSMERLLFALGINGIGAKTAKVISKKFNNIDILKTVSYEQLNEIKDIGPILAINIINYFKDEENVRELEELKKLGVNFEYKGKKIEEDKLFLNKKFVITGSFDFVNRKELKELIESKGGFTSESVSKKTDIVIVGKEPGKKYEDAINLNIEIWDEIMVKNNFNIM